VGVEVKFCGLTRAEDARVVADHGGTYAGVIFAGGPRCLDVARAERVLAAAPAGVKRVGVFGGQSVAEIADTVAALELDVAQLHAGATPARVRQVREAVGVAVWAVVRVGDAGDDTPLATRVSHLDSVADAIVLDSFVPGYGGGAGMPFDWRAVGAGERPRRARLIAAGGLTPENVREAIRALRPHIVDVSSGVERATGIKDHDRMRAFANAVLQNDGES